MGGYLFTLNPETKAVDPLLSDYLGMTARMAPDGERFLVGGADGGGMTFAVATKKLPNPSLLSPATLPEKCAWTASSTFAYCGVPQSPPRGDYPDTWYQGKVQFSDTLWELNAVTGQFTLFAIPQNEAGVTLDVEQPIASTDNHYFVFINKIDGSLWGYEFVSTLPLLPSTPAEPLSATSTHQ